MPWNVKKSGNRYAIVKALTGETVGYSDTKEKAMAAMRARYANMPMREKDMMMKKKKKMMDEKDMMMKKGR